LQFVDRQGKTLQVLGNPGNIGALRLSPDGRSVAYELLDADGRGDDLWLLDIARNTSSRLTSDPALDVMPVFSPDGKQLAFMSMRTGLGDVYVCDVRNPSIVRQVVADRAGINPSSWSPNGTLILDAVKGNQTVVETYSFTTRETTPYLGAGSGQGSVSPDGKRIAYCQVVSGQPEIFVEDFGTHDGRRQVSVSGGVMPRWRPDGKELFYVSIDRNVMSVDMTTDGAAPVPLFRYTGAGFDVSADGKRLVIANALVNRESEPLTVETSWLSRPTN